MRAAGVTSLMVLTLSTAAIASVGVEGQKTRHHHPSNDTAPNSTDMSTMNGAAMNTDMTMPATNGAMSPDGTMNNGM